VPAKREKYGTRPPSVASLLSKLTCPPMETTKV